MKREYFKTISTGDIKGLFPEDAKYIAMDRTGEIFCYYRKPECNGSAWLGGSITNLHLRIPNLEQLLENPVWTESLFSVDVTESEMKVYKIIDLPDFKHDQVILVRNYTHEEWQPRYFKEFNDAGQACAYNSGKSSLTVSKSYHTTTWKYFKAL